MKRFSMAVPVKSHSRFVSVDESLFRPGLRLDFILSILRREIHPAPCRPEQDQCEPHHDSKCDPCQCARIPKVRLEEHRAVYIILHRREAEIQDIAAVQKDGTAKRTGQINNQCKKDGW